MGTNSKRLNFTPRRFTRCLICHSFCRTEMAFTAARTSDRKGEPASPHGRNCGILFSPRSPFDSSLAVSPRIPTFPQHIAQGLRSGLSYRDSASPETHPGASLGTHPYVPRDAPSRAFSTQAQRPPGEATEQTLLKTAVPRNDAESKKHSEFEPGTLARAGRAQPNNIAQVGPCQGIAVRAAHGAAGNHCYEASTA
jgi:hypothetical protein